MSKVYVYPTDTLYGILGSAMDPDTVKRIYAIKKRDPKKPMIVLVHDMSELGKFNIHLRSDQKEFLQKYWPGKISVVLPCNDEKFIYAHRGENSLAFRVPDNDRLLGFLQQWGPMVAPSANPEGKIPAKNIQEAEQYFGDKVDEYIDGGELLGESSTIVDYTGEKPEVLRQGEVMVY